MRAKSLPLCPTLCDPMDCSPPGSSVYGILQARILGWAAMPSSRGSSRPRDQIHIFCGSFSAGRFFTAEPPGKPKYLSSGPPKISTGWTLARKPYTESVSKLGATSSKTQSSGCLWWDPFSKWMKAQGGFGQSSAMPVGSRSLYCQCGSTRLKAPGAETPASLSSVLRETQCHAQGRLQDMPEEFISSVGEGLSRWNHCRPSLNLVLQAHICY